MRSNTRLGRQTPRKSIASTSIYGHGSSDWYAAQSVSPRRNRCTIWSSGSSSIGTSLGEQSDTGSTDLKHLRFHAKPFLNQECSTAAVLGSIPCGHPLLRYDEVQDVATFCSASEAVKAPSIHSERERRCFVLMEWTSDAQFHTLLRVSLCTSLHEAVVCEHILDAHLIFYLVKVYPLCHTCCLFRDVLKVRLPLFTVAKRAENTRPLTLLVGVLLFVSLFSLLPVERLILHPKRRTPHCYLCMNAHRWG